MIDYPDLQLYIGGAWRKTHGDLPVVNPATEQEIGRLPSARTSDLDDALDAAEKGFRVWRRTAPVERAEVLRNAARLMRERIDTIAHAITLEHGKPLPQARLEVIRGVDFHLEVTH
ncbi:aldehyde dehydrogenase family protein [Variovorax sp. OV329]|uniref:aldehyde dehydrogenase family protein n=1 Tax=Variovorax sp. OV329 TaxID=1882825 RepID=UPI0008E99CD1|nr:aldehyde dehydrogenase family protein [Variovorax sp. OV329]SFN47266.1 Aldehyde dehydrogenase family protein [Variovorax sp. OV329]